jgi:hypothetical protein
LRLAVLRHRAAVLEALEAARFVASVHLERPVTGLDVERVAFFAWPEPLGRPKRVVVDVVRLDQQLIDPVSFTFDLAPEETPTAPDELPPVIVDQDAPPASRSRPKSVTVEGPDGAIVWQHVEAQTAREVLQLTRDGKPVFGHVDTTSHCYRMTCPRCGRVRYAKPNSIHQVFLCRVCMRTERLRRRALTQYRARYGKRR